MLILEWEEIHVSCCVVLNYAFSHIPVLLRPTELCVVINVFVILGLNWFAVM